MDELGETVLQLVRITTIPDGTLDHDELRRVVQTIRELDESRRYDAEIFGYWLDDYEQRCIAAEKRVQVLVRERTELLAKHERAKRHITVLTANMGKLERKLGEKRKVTINQPTTD
jgi:hypothetical protein